MKEYQNPLYLNYDSLQDQKIVEQESWHPKVDLLIFDEIQKRNQWKNYIKGIFDKRVNKRPHILVTGSARLHAFAKSGDSLAGRYFLHTLFPFSPVEIEKSESHKNISHLLDRGGFPEPLFKLSHKDTKKWRSQYIESLLRGDLLDIAPIQSYRKMNLLVDLLIENVGTPLSLNSLSRNVQLAHGTLTKYISLLEDLYLIFKVTPFSKNIHRSLLKAPKIYFYDFGLVPEEGARLENLVALSLLKHCNFLKETKGDSTNLHFLRTKDGEEVDFCLSDKKSPKQLIEVKRKIIRFQVVSREYQKNMIYLQSRSS